MPHARSGGGRVGFQDNNHHEEQESGSQTPPLSGSASAYGGGGREDPSPAGLPSRSRSQGSDDEEEDEPPRKATDADLLLKGQRRRRSISELAKPLGDGDLEQKIRDTLVKRLGVRRKDLVMVPIDPKVNPFYAQQVQILSRAPEIVVFHGCSPVSESVRPTCRFVSLSYLQGG